MKNLTAIILTVCLAWVICASASVAFLGSVPSGGSAPLVDDTNNLVLWLTFKGTNVNTETDISTNHVTMTWSSAVGYFSGPNSSSIASDQTAGQFLFSGTSAVTDTTTTNRNYSFTNQDFTICGWYRLKPTTFNGRTIFWSGAYQVSGFNFQFSETGTNLLLRSNQVGVNQDAFSSPLGYTTNVWYHIAAVRSGSNATFYFMGSQVGSTNAFATAAPSSRPMKLGADTLDAGGGAGYQLNGYAADERIYNVAKTAGQIAQIYGTGTNWAK